MWSREKNWQQSPVGRDSERHEHEAVMVIVPIASVGFAGFGVGECYEFGCGNERWACGTRFNFEAFCLASRWKNGVSNRFLHEMDNSYTYVTQGRMSNCISSYLRLNAWISSGFLAWPL
ncbi:hypothetical protein V8G54_029105 [Vigna mungo]|uniref:Uncharacterized protein n=1 Tax=Vigna mungo TaxID=3915 RepID=A0AAQ3MSQ3_VIGMU